MKKIISRRKFAYYSAALVATVATVVLGTNVLANKNKHLTPNNTEDGTFKLKILATSDTHGKMFPWNYTQNTEDTSGSMAQVSTAVTELRDKNTILLDAGDTTQGNFAEIFTKIDDVHPMIQAMNAIGYDTWTTGNHEYNFGMDHLKRVISSLSCKPLLGNVRDQYGNYLADPYTIIERGGVKVGIIGMVTPNITKWDKHNLEGYTVSDPADEINNILSQIKDKTDIAVGLFHMMEEDEYNAPHSGFTSIAQNCPDLDVIIGAHGHKLIEGKTINDVLAVENKNAAQTMIEINLDIEKNNGKTTVVNKNSRAITIGNYSPDPNFSLLLGKYDSMAKEYANEIVGTLEGGKLVPETGIKGIPLTPIQPTALIKLINDVMMHYSGAAVSATFTSSDASPQIGSLHRYDIAQIYKYTNTLYKYRATGKQLRQHMEWAASYYQQYKDGDLTIAFNPNIQDFNNDAFGGVNYKIDISKPVGSRIVDLCWPNGIPVKDDEIFIMAVNNYRGDTQYTNNSNIYDDNPPELLEVDIRGDIGDIPALIVDYIQTIKNGILTPENNPNWEIIGCMWDAELHQKAIDQLNAGIITVENTARTPNIKAITEADLKY